MVQRLSFGAGVSMSKLCCSVRCGRLGSVGRDCPRLCLLWVAVHPIRRHCTPSDRVHRDVTGVSRRNGCLPAPYRLRGRRATVRFARVLLLGRECSTGVSRWWPSVGADSGGLHNRARPRRGTASPTEPVSPGKATVQRAGRPTAGVIAGGK